MIDRGTPFLSCPRCGLSIRPKVSRLPVEHCPRCMARARIAVKMFASTLPASELYPQGSAPKAEQRGVTTTIAGKSR
jgi:hypothetical protein